MQKNNKRRCSAHIKIYSNTCNKIVVLLQRAPSERSMQQIRICSATETHTHTQTHADTDKSKSVLFVGGVCRRSGSHPVTLQCHIWHHLFGRFSHGL